MDYSICFYRGRYVYDAKDYLNAIRNNSFNVIYDPRNREKMLNEIEGLIDYYKSVDLYAYAQLLYDEATESSLAKCFSILDIIVSWDYVPAKHLLAQMYFYGAGVEKDMNKFYSLSLEAANANFILSKNALALAYFNGYGCKPNYEKGYKLLEECANADYGFGYFNLGVGYFNGLYGYPKDENKAFAYFKQASEQYHKGAYYNLGLMYLNGKGCRKNISKGLDALINAANLGQLKAQVKVADMYYFGEIIPKNLDSAYAFYLMAAEAGDPYSMYSVAYMILYKEKSRVDRSIGMEWLRKAAYLGYDKALELINKL